MFMEDKLQRDLGILRKYSRSLQEWRGDELTYEGYLAEVPLEAVEGLVFGAPFSSLVPLFSLSSFKFLIAPLKVISRQISLKTPFPKEFSFLWPRERVFDLEGREALSGEMPKEFLYLNGSYPANSLVGLFYEINLPLYRGVVVEKLTFCWLAENKMSPKQGLKLLRNQAIKDAAFQVIFDLETNEIVQKVNRRHPWHTEPRRFLEALDSLNDDFVFSDLVLSDEEGG